MLKHLEYFLIIKIQYAFIYWDTAFKYNSLKKITPPEVWLQGMLKLRKKHHKHRYEVKQRNTSIKNKSIDY